MTRALAVFGYGSLVNRASVTDTLGSSAGEPIPARLAGWRRRWSLVRDNRTAEKGFAPAGDDEPFDWCLGLNIEPGNGDDWLNGALIEIHEAALERLRLRELRYDEVDVTDAVSPASFERVVAFRAKASNFAGAPPPRAVVIATYLEACEVAFEGLGPGQLEAFHATTESPPVPVVSATLIRDEVPPGNPRGW